MPEGIRNVSEDITKEGSYPDANTYTITTTNMDPSSMLETTKYWIAQLLYNNIVIDQEVISINKQGKTGAKGDAGPQGKTRRIFKYTEGQLKINFQYYCNSMKVQRSIGALKM